jgi:short-subunit dehydrogenase
VVTGGSSGVGRAIALELARRGGRVLATARRRDRLEALAAGAAALPGAPVLTRAGDVTDAAFRRSLVAEAAAELGGIDLVVAAAGSGAIGPFRAAHAATLERIMAVDFVAPVELVRESLPELLRGRDPGIVLVGSILGRHPLPLHAEYCAAKAALASFAGVLGSELAADGVDVLLASLGPTESEFWESLLTGSRPAWSRGRPMPADRTARIVLDALARRRREVFPGLGAKAFAVAARLFPGLLDRAMMGAMRRSREPV